MSSSHTSDITSTEITKPTEEATAMNTRSTINKMRIATGMSSSHTRITLSKSRISTIMIPSNRRKTLAKRKQQIEHWMSVLEYVQQQHQGLEPVTKMTNNDDHSLSDVDINPNDLGSFPASREEIKSTTEEVSHSFSVS
jgi:hypothetical protein